MTKLITHFWYYQKESNNFSALFLLFPMSLISSIGFYNVVLSDGNIVPKIIGILLVCIPSNLVVLFLKPFAKYQSEQRK